MFELDPSATPEVSPIFDGALPPVTPVTPPTPETPMTPATPEATGEHALHPVRARGRISSVLSQIHISEPTRP
jgi:hypothetical protein